MTVSPHFKRGQELPGIDSLQRTPFAVPSTDRNDSHQQRLTFLYKKVRSVLSGLFPLAYALVLTCLLLQAFRMMRLSSASVASAPRDRTGLKTIHPELLDENGLMTNENSGLFASRTRTALFSLKLERDYRLWFQQARHVASFPESRRVQGTMMLALCLTKDRPVAV